MTSNIHKWTGWLMVFITAAPLFIVTGFFVRQKYVQHEMAERLEKKHLHTITVQLTSVRWIEQDKEATIQGKLFDVKNYRITGNTITLTGLYDTEEEDVKEELTNLLKQKKGNTPPLHQLIFKFFNAASVNEAPAETQLPSEIVLSKIYRPYQDKLPQQYRTIITPPPNV